MQPASVLVMLALILSSVASQAVGRHPRPIPSQPALSGRWLMHETSWGVLSSISTLQGIEGAPFGNPQSVVDGPYHDGLLGDNSTGIPYFFVSEMDVSQVDALSNSLVSLTCSEAALANGCTLTDPESPVCIRLTVTGEMVEVVDEEEKAFAMQALFQRHPKMEGWPTDHDWKVKKIVPRHVFVLDMFGGVKALNFMTSLDFKALRKKERAKLQRQKQQENQYQNKGTLSRIHLDAPLILAHRFSLDLIKFKVSPGAIDGIYYVPEWLSEEDARQLLEAIDQAPAGLWTNLQNRRLQNLGGTPASATGKGMRCLPVPSYGHAMFEALVAAGVFASDTAPNHILLNEYSNGQGIALHKDGPLYQNRVAIVSLGAPALIEFWDRPHLNDLNAPRCSGSNFPSHPSSATVRLEHRSLLVFEGDAYEKYWHGILRRHELPAEESGDRGKEDRRMSLTVRRVLNVCEADKEMLETAETVREEKRENARFLMSISDDR